GTRRPVEDDLALLLEETNNAFEPILRFQKERPGQCSKVARFSISPSTLVREECLFLCVAPVGRRVRTRDPPRETLRVESVTKWGSAIGHSLHQVVKEVEEDRIATCRCVRTISAGLAEASEHGSELLFGQRRPRRALRFRSARELLPEVIPYAPAGDA